VATEHVRDAGLTAHGAVEAVLPDTSVHDFPKSIDR